MKRYLLSFLLIACAFLNKSYAQCTITDVSIAPTSIDQNNNCQIQFDLIYTADVNPGAKYVIVYLWKAQDYPGYVSTDYPLSTSKTSTLLGTLIIGDPGGTPYLVTTRPSDMKKNTTPLSSILNASELGYSTNTNGTRTYSFSGVKANVSGCTSQVVIKGDVWATQNSQNASCMTAGAINVIANDPVMNGLLDCKQRRFSITFKTIASQNITFSAYLDVNDNGVFDNADKLQGKLNLNGPNVINQTDIEVLNPASIPTTYGYYSYYLQPGIQHSVFIAARVAGNNYDNVLLLDNTCSNTLPVSFKSFTASRANSANTLKWTTSTEINNKGFYVQRFYNSQWTNVMFVASKAENGNSSTDLNYAVNDVFNFKGVVQYRILQVDIDGRSKYSDVRSLSSMSQAGNALVYPNPAATNGNISIILADATSNYDIQIIDNSGRIVKKFTDVRGNQQVSGLPRGQYMARVMDKLSGESSVDKFIVQ